MDNRKKKIVLTGASGSLGTQILSSRRINVFDVYALTSKPEECETIYSAQKNIHFYHKDEYRTIPWHEIDVLISCAFPLNGDGIKMADGLRYIEELLLCATEGGVRGVINISSQSVYSQKRLQAADEQAQLNLETSYAVGKYAAELLVDTLSASVPHTSLRIGNLVGARSKNRILNRLIKQIISGEDIRVWNTNRHFDYLDIRDAADAVLCAAENDAEQWRDVYNLGSGRVYDLIDFVRVSNEAAEKRGLPPVRVVVEESAKEGEWGCTALDSSLFYEQFDWRPRYSLEDTVGWIFDAALAGSSTEI